jgi:ATP-binding protein involved in chromosome partitioning
LTMCQKMPVTAAVMVTTPQQLSLLDVKRACAMFTKLNLPILGVVENMSSHHCQACGHEEAIFGEGGEASIRAELGETLLASIPLDSKLRDVTDTGLFFTDATSFGYASLFQALALRVVGKIACLPIDYSAKFPPIKIEG